ncbi:MAG: MOSC domain-containing protein, partial [Betaproteobacteria bacterium]|nr:MOSC domain-containing protein [Betaproteobacteria bacterium]
FDESSGTATIERAGRRLLSAVIILPEGRQAFEEFFAGFLAGNPDGPPRLVEVPGRTFADARPKPNASTDQYVSLVNLASVRDLELVAPAPVDPLRFRANVHFDGAPAWEELSWVGREFSLGSARLRVVSPTIRCAATAVNPATAERDMDVPSLLIRHFRHNHMGVYAEVVAGGAFDSGCALAWR